MQGSGVKEAGRAWQRERSSRGRGRGTWEGWGRAWVPVCVRVCVCERARWTPGDGSCCCPSVSQWLGPPLLRFLRDWRRGGQRSAAQSAAMGGGPAHRPRPLARSGPVASRIFPAPCLARAGLRHGRQTPEYQGAPLRSPFCPDLTFAKLKTGNRMLEGKK